MKNSWRWKARVIQLVVLNGKGRGKREWGEVLRERTSEEELFEEGRCVCV